MISPSGTALASGSGYRLSGRWQWATGVMHSDWVIVGAVTENDDLGSICFFALPIGDVEVEDTWTVDGMCATGSNDVVIDDVFVPAERVVSVPDMVLGRAHGARLHEGPLYRTPMIPILLLAAAMPAVGQARAVVSAFRTRLLERARLMGPVQAQRASAQIRLAQAEIEVRQAELMLRDVAAAVMEKRDTATPAERAGWAASTAHVVHQCRRTILDVAEASGASAHFLSHPLQRAVRDVNVMSCHIIFDRDAQRENFGRLLLGYDPTSPLF
jgi:alkylation response protein AidB-like acyl-CoA dehydrogenase